MKKRVEDDHAEFRRIIMRIDDPNVWKREKRKRNKSNLLPPITNPIDSKTLERMLKEDESLLQAEFRRQGGWTFDPTEFDFRITKHWNKGILGRDFDKSDYWDFDNSDYWYEASRTVQEAYNAEHLKKNPGCCGEIFYTCIINKIGAKDCRFTVIENNYNDGGWGNDAGPTKFEYTVPNVEVANIILAELIPVGHWYKEKESQ